MPFIESLSKEIDELKDLLLTYENTHDQRNLR